MSLPICPGRLRAGNGAQRKARKQEGVKLKSAMRRRRGKVELAMEIELVTRFVSRRVRRWKLFFQLRKHLGRFCAPSAHVRPLDEFAR